MKKLFLSMAIILIIIAVSSNANKTIDNYNEKDITFSFSFEEPIITNIYKYNTNYSRVILSECDFYAKPGEPRLPVKPLRILLPQGSSIKSIDVSTSSPINLDQNIDSIELGETAYPLSLPPENITPPTPTYDVNNLYPEKLYNKIGVQYCRGYTILCLNLHPVQYDGQSHSVKYYPQMNIHISTTSTSSHPLYRGLKKDENQLKNNVELVDESIVSTYETSLVNQISTQSNYEYVIITTEEFKNYDGTYDFNKLILKRQQQGLTTSIKTVEEIYEEYPGKDKQEQIRNFIKDAYSNWNTDWVLLAGDVEYVPVRYLYDIDGGDVSMASDIYYQCLDGDFNFDNDSWYGEKKDGVNRGLIDLYAEIYLGRACVDNTEQIENFVRKTLAYESYEWGFDLHLDVVESVGEYVWSSSGGWGAGYVERCIDHCVDYGQDTYGIPSNQYTIQRLYERDKRYGEIDLLQDINNGVNIINHLGHSNPKYCMRFSPDEIFNFTNDKYGFWYSQGCHPGQFEVTDECISEAWTLASNGGFAAIMNTGFGYGSGNNYDGPDNRFAREFWDALNNTEEKISRLGKANQDSKEDNIWHIDDGIAMYHNYYSTSLFGDPYVQIKGMEDFRADFSWSPSFPKPNSTIYFEDKSLSALSYKWDFDDGSNSEEKNPSHAYEQEGIYNVTLGITGEKNKEDNITRQVKVFENWPPFAVPNPKNIASDIPTIQFQAENSWDPDGTVVEYYWDFDDGNTSDKIAPAHKFANDGIYNVTLTVTDNLGKKGSTQCDIRIDQHTPPITEIIVGGERGENNWIISPAHISIQAFDWSDIKKIKYKIDENDWKTYINPVRIESNGIHTIEYYSKDIWGNTEETRSETFKIDSTPPMINIHFNGTMKNGWYTSSLLVQCDGADNCSGLNNIFYKIFEDHENWQIYSEPFQISKEGISTFSVYSEDNAGLTNGKNKSYTVAIDQKSPETSCFLSGDPSPGGSITVTLEAVDNGIGVEETYYSLSNESFKEYIGPISVNQDGLHIISFYSVDLLSHVESVKKQEFYIGNKPEVEIISPSPGLYFNNNQIFSLKDKIVAIGSINISVDYSPMFLSIDQISFYVDGVLKKTISSSPFNWQWNEICFGKHVITVKAYSKEYSFQTELSIIKII